MPGERAILLPAEVKEDRIGYVGVRVEPSTLLRLNRVELLGFVRAADIDESATKAERFSG
jgi:hypothetical protein